MAPATGGMARQLTREGGFGAFESPDGKHLYYAKGRSVSGLWRMPLGGGPEEPVLGQLKAGYWGYWGICNAGIVFADRDMGAATSSLFLLQLPSRTITRVASMSKPIIIGDSGMAVTQDCRQILVAQTDQSGSDLMMVKTNGAR
jgi:hypothetical protein